MNSNATCVSGNDQKGADWYEDRPWTLAAFTAETPVISDQDLMDRSRRSRKAVTRKQIGKAIGENRQPITFSS